MSIQLTKLTEDLNIISALADQPTITSTALKAKFDEASGIIKDYINNTLIDDVEDAFNDMAEDLQEAIQTIQSLLDSLTAENITYDNTSSGLTATNVQNAIDELKTGLNTLSTSIGNVNTTAGKKTVYSDFERSTGSRSDNLAKSAPTSATYTLDCTITKAGYFPIGIVGFHYVKGDVDSELLRYELTSRSSGRAVVTYKLKLNNTIDVTNHTLWFSILWVKIR